MTVRSGTSSMGVLSPYTKLKLPSPPQTSLSPFSSWSCCERKTAVLSQPRTDYRSWALYAVHFSIVSLNRKTPPPSIAEFHWYGPMHYSAVFYFFGPPCTGDDAMLVLVQSPKKYSYT